MQAKTVVVLQSNYIPWKGYFDLINTADEFIFHDDIQYTQQDWRNRNKIKTSNGVKWLSIPVGGTHRKMICEVEMKDPDWKKTHRKKIEGAYAGAAFFNDYRFILNELYDNRINNLSQYNQHVIKFLYQFLGGRKTLTDSKSYAANGASTERLLDILKKSGATKYISGPSGKNYLEESRFEEEGIKLEYFSYEGYPEYRQLHGSFVHEVSILDLIFNEGKNAVKFMKNFKA
jgi:hypothetical protein